MKLFEMKADQVADALVLITPAATNIMQDDEFINTLTSSMPKLKENATDKEKEEHNKKSLKVTMNKITNLVPLLLSKHRNDVYAILAATQAKTIEEIKEMTFKELYTAIKEIFEDSDLIDFFTSAKTSEQEQ